MVVLSGIMVQNLRPETGWHLRGARRVGVSYEDVETVQQCVRIHSSSFESENPSCLRIMILQIEAVAAFAGMHLNKVPRVADIEHEV